ncbi:MAG: hypothetical protein H7242_05060, partial [Microbacteriaceae bacterium]|nr:hypothetical protein [Burkholderiaceae bacterium]
MNMQSLFCLSPLAAAALIALASPAFAATYTFNNGNYVPGVTAPDPLGATDVLNIGAGGSKFFSSITLTNNGTVNWGADTLYLSSSTFNNNGLWNASSDDALNYYSGSQPSFFNTGIFRKSAGTGATSIGSIAFSNSGTIDTQTGSIVFAGGNTSFLAGTQFTGAGVAAVTNNANFTGAFSSANLALQSGTFTGNGAVVNGLVNFSGGTMTGDWTVGGGQQLLLQSGGSKFISSATLKNQGSVRWLGGNDTLYLSSTAIANSGLFDVQGNLNLNYYSGGQPSFTNTGTVQVATGNTLTLGSIALVNNGGTLNAAAGATINYGGGSASFNNGTVFGGAGSHVVTNNASFVGSFTAQNLALQSGTFAGGDGVTPGTTGNAGATLLGNLAFNGGTLT